MMSGVELNALMNQVAEGGDITDLSNGKVAVPRPTANYNREIWRVQNAVLERTLVEFVIERTREKLLTDLTANRKPTLTLFKEDWFDLIVKLKRIIDDIVNQNQINSWVQSIVITHQLCAQKYRNLKKVYHISKQKDSRKFAYKQEFKELEELNTASIHENATNLTEQINDSGFGPITMDSDNQCSVKTEPDACEIEEIFVEESDSPDSSYTSPQHSNGSPDSMKIEPNEKKQIPIKPTLPIVLAGTNVIRIGADELLSRLAKNIINQNGTNTTEGNVNGPARHTKVKIINTRPCTDMSLKMSEHIKIESLSGEPSSPNNRGNGTVTLSVVEKAVSKLSSMVEIWHKDNQNHHRRMDGLMTNRNKILEEGNKIARQRLELEKEKFEFVKLQRTIAEMDKPRSDTSDHVVIKEYAED